MSDPRCLCGSKRYELLVEGDYSAIPESGKAVHFQAMKCLACDLVFTNPAPTTDESLYQGYYYKDGPPNDDWSTNYSNYRASRLGPYLNSLTKNLEIGCADGQFVERIKSLGVTESIGVELSKPTATAGRALGRDIRDSDLRGCGFPAGHFDIVQAHHVLEHIYHLHGFLDEVHRVIKPGGIFYVTLPRYNSVFVKKNPNWLGWYPQQHFWHFSEKTLTRLLKSHEFELLDMACVRVTNYFPVQARKGVLNPVKVSVKRLINYSVKRFKLGDQIDAFFQAV